MRTLAGSCLLLGIAAMFNAKAAQSESGIQVLVYNYAGVPAGTLARAEQEAARIYSCTGIGTEWLDCPLTSAEAAKYPGCDVPVTPTRLAVRLLSRPMAERAGLSAATFGSALFPDNGAFGMIVQVCWHCVANLAEGREGMQAAVLGHVMAHELGHLLLGMGSHGATGLMHVPWHKKELERVAQWLLLFTPWEGERMRQQVLARIAAEAPARSDAIGVTDRRPPQL